MTDRAPLPLLADYTQHVARIWRRLLVAAVVGALLGAAIHLVLPVRYVATGKVALSEQLSYVSLSSDGERQPLVTLDTTAALLHSDAAADQVARALRVDAQEAREAVTLSAEPLTRVLVLEVRADSPAAARAGSRAATRALLALQRDTFALSPSKLRVLKTRVTVLRNQAYQAISEGDPAEDLFDTVDILTTRLDRAVATNNTNSAVIEQAVVTSYRPGQLSVLIGSGIGIGLLLALLSAGRFTRRAAAAVRREPGLSR